MSHRLRIEVTVAACLESPDHQIVGDNMADTTLVFSKAVGTPPANADLSDAVVQSSLGHAMGPVLAVLQTVLPQLGLTFDGTVDDPMLGRSSTVVGFGTTEPVRVQIGMPAAPGNGRIA